MIVGRYTGVLVSILLAGWWLNTTYPVRLPNRLDTRIRLVRSLSDALATPLIALLIEEDGHEEGISRARLFGFGLIPHTDSRFFSGQELAGAQSGWWLAQLNRTTIPLFLLFCSLRIHLD